VSKKFLTSIRLLNLTSDPQTGQEGEMYFNSNTDKIRIYYNNSWHNLTSESLNGGGGGGGGGGSSETPMAMLFWFGV
jgi:uncharacterized membrane protein